MLQCAYMLDTLQLEQHIEGLPTHLPLSVLLVLYDILKLWINLSQGCIEHLWPLHQSVELY